VIALLIAAVSYSSYRPMTEEITYRELNRWLEEKKIEQATVTPTPYTGIYLIEGTRRQGNASREFAVTTHVPGDQLPRLFNAPGVTVQVPGKGWKGLLVNLIPTLIIGGLLIGLLCYQLNVGKGKKHKVKERPNVRFADVAGVEEAKHELQEIVDFLKQPKKYRKVGGKLPKGILLIGPPGTGKTMLAKAVAGEAEANFFSAHGSDFNEVFVGVGAKRIREIFAEASRNRPAIIFIDEIDCLGKSRKTEGHSEMQQTNNALLAAMDGFENSEGIIVLAATNRPEDLDEALMRPGRFDRKVVVPLPDIGGRRAILEVHAQQKPIADKDRTLEVLAQTTCEMSGADLASVINEAAILCARNDEEEITLSHLEASRDKIRYGKERHSAVMNQEERELVAYHEAGHTIINLRKSLLPPLYKVSIIPRGRALGVTTLMPTKDQLIHSKTFLLEELEVLMGGRAAERLFFGCTSNGAAGDLDSAKKIARHMNHDWGMGKKLYYQPEHREAEEEINCILQSADEEAFKLVQSEKDNTHKLAQALLKYETLTRQQVLDLLYENKVPKIDKKYALN
jgi:cell division protease FtsH